MEDILALLTTNFTNHADIVAKVGTRCSFLTETQDSPKPFIAFNLSENEVETKDGSRRFDMVILIVSSDLSNLLSIYETARTTILESNANLYPQLVGSSFPERIKEWDDNYVIDLTFNLNL